MISAPTSEVTGRMRLVRLALCMTMDCQYSPLMNGLKYYETRRFPDQGPESVVFAKRWIELFLHVQFVVERFDIRFRSAIVCCLPSVPV